MTDKLEKLLQNKNNYINRLIRAFKPIHPVSEFSKPTPTIPRAFKDIDPADMRWATRPQSMLAVFQKMILHIQDPQWRMGVLNNLLILTDSQGKSYIDDNRLHLQDQIFRAVTGRHYGTPPNPAVYFSSITHEDLQSRDFFRLIGMGIRAYENMPKEKQEQFNAAVMPKVKKKDIEVPYRLQQYVR
jgi:hypothetical protein